jgi:LysM repeat protein
MIKKSLVFMALTTLIYSNDLIKLKAEVVKKNDGIVIEISKSDKIKENKNIETSTTKVKTHIVKRNETLAGIALKYNKKVSTIIKNNKIKNIDLIFEGKTLTIN